MVLINPSMIRVPCGPAARKPSWIFLVVGVPVILVSPGEWEKSKGVVYTGAGLWFGLVIVTAAFNSFII